MRLGLVVCAILGLSASLQAANSLAILCSDSSCGTVQTSMLATTAFSVVDMYDVSSTNPSLGTISGYNAVLAYTNSTAGDPTGLGNLLASYANLGGKHVTIATYSFSTPWAILGTIMTGNFAALTNVGTNGTVGTTMVAVVPGDPIFTGVTLSSVTYFVNSNYAHPGLAAGATLLANDGGANGMIARSSGGVINVNVWPGGSGANPAFFTLLANTLTLGPTVTAAPPTTPIPTTWLLMLTGMVGLTLYQSRERLMQLIRRA